MTFEPNINSNAFVYDYLLIKYIIHILPKQKLLTMKKNRRKTEKQLNLHVVISTFKAKVEKDLELLNKEYNKIYFNSTELDLYDNNLNNKLDILLGKIEVLEKTLNYL